MKKLLSYIILLLLAVQTSAAEANQLVVAQDGSGDYTTISAAIESLPMYNYFRVTIFVKNGTYTEKIRINRDHITLIGESREHTRIAYNQVREDWIAHEDAIGPAVVNIYADDIILQNLTIENTQPEIGPHAFAVYGTGTRTIIQNCTVLSKGGDTVSLWDYKSGMYYMDSCYFQGAVDFVCPRGWCYISNSTFHELKNTAAVWHAAADGNAAQKFVLANCRFTGADSFYLARHHYDAQFYFLNCEFPALMRNKAIEHCVYPDEPQRTRPYLHGDRYYFENCHRVGGDYAWFADNLKQRGIKKEQITAAWTFDQKWNPVDTSPLTLAQITYEGSSLFLWFKESVNVNGEPVLLLPSGTELQYYKGQGWPRVEFRAKEALDASCLKETIQIRHGSITGNKAAVKAQKLNSIIK